MAEEGSLADKLKLEKLSLRGFAECHLCNKPYRAPKLLPCLHTYCLGCIEQWVKNMVGEDEAKASKVPCPKCSLPFKAESGDDLHSLKDNLLARRLARLRLMSEGEGEEGGVGACSACSSDDSGEESKSAEMFCVDCCEKLCEGCAKVHLQFKLTRGHKILPLTDLASGLVRGASASEQPTYCDDHPGEHVTFFCTQCVEAVCAKCLLTVHKSHPYLDVDEAASTGVQEMNDLIGRLEDHVTKHRAVIGQGEERKAELLRELENTEKEVLSKAEQLKALIERYHSGMKKALADIRTRKVSLLEDHVTDAKNSIERMNMVKMFSDILKEKGTKAELATLSTMLRDKARDLASIPATEVRFLADISIDWERKDSLAGHKLEDLDNFLGKLTLLEKSGGLEDEGAELYLAPPLTLGNIAGMKFVQGVAVVGEMLYVVRDRMCEVEAFLLSSLEGLGRIEVGDMEEPVGMTSSSRHRLLYIAAGADKAIYVVPAVIGQSSFKKWTIPFKPKGVSVSSDERVWVTCQEDAVVLELSSDGAVLQEIKLHDDITEPWLTLSLENTNTLLVCHGNQGSAKHRLVEVGLDGSVLNSYDGTTSSSHSDVALNMPNYIAVDNNGYILLLDYFTSCVRLISSRLVFRRYLLSGADQGLSGPTCMCLDVDKGVLCVGQFDGKVHVFRIMKDLVVKLHLNNWQE